MLFFFTVVCLGNTVLQSPGNIIRNQNEFAVIECEHNIPSYNLLLWYKQTQNLFLLMGYLYLTNENKEPGFVTKTKLDGDARKNGTLTIKTLTLNESAVYFCAAWYTMLKFTSV